MKLEHIIVYRMRSKMLAKVITAISPKGAAVISVKVKEPNVIRNVSYITWLTL